MLIGNACLCLHVLPHMHSREHMSPEGADLGSLEHLSAWYFCWCPCVCKGKCGYVWSTHVCGVVCTCVYIYPPRRRDRRVVPMSALLSPQMEFLASNKDRWLGYLSNRKPLLGPLLSFFLFPLLLFNHFPYLLHSFFFFPPIPIPRLQSQPVFRESRSESLPQASSTILNMPLYKNHRDRGVVNAPSQYSLNLPQSGHLRGTEREPDTYVD